MLVYFALSIDKRVIVVISGDIIIIKVGVSGVRPSHWLHE